MFVWYMTFKGGQNEQKIDFLAIILSKFDFLVIYHIEYDLLLKMAPIAKKIIKKDLEPSKTHTPKAP